MVHGKPKEFSVDSIGDRKLDGSRADTIVRDFITSKQSPIYRRSVGAFRIIAIGTAISCLLMIPMILKILYTVDEVTRSTNDIVKPTISQHEEQLKKFYNDPKAFDEYMKQRKL